ncbi:MAG: homoserine kinase, partial [Bacteroidetes bacterium]|nr:homoserine kinase [Bacteroidota bacterium]
FAPATVANVTCGFDILGFPLEDVGDKLTLKVTKEKQIRITKIEGFDLPYEASKNVAGVVIQKLVQDLGINFGFEVEIEKGVKPGSGVGSSAASAAAAAFAVNELAGKPLKIKELVKYAMEGEKLASGIPHADNVAPSLIGNFTLIRSYDPLDIIQLDSPADLFCTLIHPHIQINTADSRKILKKNISLELAIKQWGNVAGLITGINLSDYDLIGRSMNDVIIEPTRSILIPMFEKIKEASIRAGALGCGIAGSGPSVFAFSKGEKMAMAVKDIMNEIYRNIDVNFDLYVSKINPKGAKVLHL